MAQNWLSQVLINLSSIWNEDFMTLWHTKLFIKIFDYWPLLFFGILWVERIGTIWAQKIGHKSLMKLTLFIDCLLLKSCIQAIKTCRSHQFLLCNFLFPTCFDTPNSHATHYHCIKFPVSSISLSKDMGYGQKWPLSHTWTLTILGLIGLMVTEIKVIP